MATLIWTGNAAPRAQVSQIEFPGKVRVGDKFSATINGKTLTYTATTDKLADVCSGLAELIGAYGNTIAEWAEVSAEADGERLVLTGPTDGKPFTVTAVRGEVASLSIAVAQVQQGYAGKSEVQRIAIVGTATSGNFTLSFRGQTTGNIAYNANAATVQSALEGLSTIGSGNVTVSGTGPWDVTFAGGFAFANPDLITASGSGLSKSGSYTVSVTTTVGAKAGKNKIVRIIDPSGGNASSDVSIRSNDGSTVGPWDGDATAATVQGLFDTEFGANNTIVRRPSLGVWDVEFVGKYANINAPLIGETDFAVGSTSIVCSTEVTRSTEGHGTINSQWRLTPPTYGTYALTWTDPRTGNRVGSGTLAYSATAAEIERSIGDLYAQGAGPSCVAVVPTSGDPSDTTGPFVLTFLGPLAGQNVADVAVTAGTVEQTQTGDFESVAEVQSLRIYPYPTAGAYTLGWKGSTSGNIGYADSISTIQTTLNSAFGSNAVVVAEGDTLLKLQRELRFTFTDKFGPREPLLVTQTTTLTSSEMTIATIQEPTEPTCEEQLVALGNAPGGGTFTLTYNGNTSSSMAWNAAPSLVEKELSALVTGETNPCTVSGPDGGPWRVKFGGTMAGRNALAITGSAASLSGSRVSLSRIVRAESPENERQQITLRGSPSGGTFTLTFGGQTTGSIVYNASADVVQAALEALSSVGYGNVLVSAPNPGGPFVVEFIGSLAAANQGAITSSSSLSGSATLANVEALTAPTGPNWFSEPLNFSTGAVPVNSDILIFENNAVPCLYGLEDLSSVTLAELHVRQSYTAESLGLPTHTGQYVEYRPLALKIGATKLYQGQGDGSGCPLVRINTHTAASEVLVMGTGQPSGSLPAFCWVGNNSSNVVRAFRGSIGLAAQGGETGQLVTLQVGYIDSPETDASVIVGAGLGTITTLSQIGGTVVCAASVTTATNNGGQLEFTGAAAVGTLRANSGPVYYSSSGTLTQGYVGAEGQLLFTRDMRARTVTNCTIVAGAVVRDPNRSVTWTNSIVLSQCGLADVELHLGTHVTVAVAVGP